MYQELEQSDQVIYENANQQYTACINCNIIPENYISLICGHNYCLQCIVESYIDPDLCKKNDDNSQAEIICEKCSDVTNLDYNAIQAIENCIQQQQISKQQYQNLKYQQQVEQQQQFQNQQQSKYCENKNEQNNNNNIKNDQNSYQPKIKINQTPISNSSRYQLPKDDVITEESIETYITDEMQKLQLTPRNVNLVQIITPKQQVTSQNQQDLIFKQTVNCIDIQNNLSQQQSQNKSQLTTNNLESNQKNSNLIMNKSQQSKEQIIQECPFSSEKSIKSLFNSDYIQMQQQSNKQSISQSQVLQNKDQCNISPIQSQHLQKNIENQKKQKQRKQHQALSQNCDDHPLEEAQLFCFTCEGKCICAQCIAEKGDHRNHDVKNTENSLILLKQRLENTLLQVKAKIQFINHNKENYELQKQQIHHQSKNLDNQINEIFSSIINNIETKMIQMKKHLEQQTMNSLENIEIEFAKIEEAKLTLGTLLRQLEVFQQTSNFQTDLSGSTLIFNYYAECKRILNEIMNSLTPQIEPSKLFDQSTFMMMISKVNTFKDLLQQFQINIDENNETKQQEQQQIWNNFKMNLNNININNDDRHYSQNSISGITDSVNYQKHLDQVNSLSTKQTFTNKQTLFSSKFLNDLLVKNKKNISNSQQQFKYSQQLIKVQGSQQDDSQQFSKDLKEQSQLYRSLTQRENSSDFEKVKKYSKQNQLYQKLDFKQVNKLQQSVQSSLSNKSSTSQNSTLSSLLSLNNKNYPLKVFAIQKNEINKKQKSTDKINIIQKLDLEFKENDNKFIQEVKKREYDWFKLPNTCRNRSTSPNSLQANNNFFFNYNNQSKNDYQQQSYSAREQNNNSQYQKKKSLSLTSQKIINLFDKNSNESQLLLTKYSKELQQSPYFRLQKQKIDYEKTKRLFKLGI